MILSLIAAADENNVIGGQGTLPWSLPDDLKRFKSLTQGHPIIMGRKTYQSIGRVLPKRLNIIISKQPGFAVDGAVVVDSIGAALKAAEADPTGQAFVIGGGEVYAQLMDRADRIELTRVHGEFLGDAFFPAIDPHAWHETGRVEHAADDAHAYPFTFITYQRKK